MSQVCWRLFSWIEGLVLKVLRRYLWQQGYRILYIWLQKDGCVEVYFEKSYEVV